MKEEKDFEDDLNKDLIYPLFYFFYLRLVFSPLYRIVYHISLVVHNQNYFLFLLLVFLILLQNLYLNHLQNLFLLSPLFFLILLKNLLLLFLFFSSSYFLLLFSSSYFLHDIVLNFNTNAVQQTDIIFQMPRQIGTYL